MLEINQTKIGTKTIGVSTYEVIKHDIIFGQLQPGIKLKLEKLKSKYDVSVSTLREILNRLASEGFIQAEEQRGFFVSPVSANDLVEIANLRILLENYALKISIENGDADWEGEIIAAHHKLSQMEKKIINGNNSEIETWKKYDRDFHQALIMGCKSRNLHNLHSVIYSKYLRYQMLLLSFRGEKAAMEHLNLLNASLERNVEKAQKILELHIQNGLEDAMEKFKDF